MKLIYLQSPTRRDMLNKLCAIHMTGCYEVIKNHIFKPYVILREDAQGTKPSGNKENKYCIDHICDKFHNSILPSYMICPCFYPFPTLCCSCPCCLFPHPAFSWVSLLFPRDKTTLLGIAPLQAPLLSLSFQPLQPELPSMHWIIQYQSLVGTFKF